MKPKVKWQIKKLLYWNHIIYKLAYTGKCFAANVEIFSHLLHQTASILNVRNGFQIICSTI